MPRLCRTAGAWCVSAGACMRGGAGGANGSEHGQAAAAAVPASSQCQGVLAGGWEVAVAPVWWTMLLMARAVHSQWTCILSPTGAWPCLSYHTKPPSRTCPQLRREALVSLAALVQAVQCRLQDEQGAWQLLRTPAVEVLVAKKARIVEVGPS